MSKLKILAIVGKSGSGKSTIIKSLKSQGISTMDMYFPIPYTTRPKRNNEVDGNEYYFYKDENLINSALNIPESVLCGSEYNNWKYLYFKNNFHPIYVNIITSDLTQLAQLYMLEEKHIIDLQVLEIAAEDRVLKRRLIYRPDTVSGEYSRRIKADKKEYNDFIFKHRIYDYAVNNNKNDLEDIITKIKEKVSRFF